MNVAVFPSQGPGMDMMDTLDRRNLCDQIGTAGRRDALRDVGGRDGGLPFSVFSDAQRTGQIQKAKPTSAMNAPLRTSP
jgi:hypothetical protein